jgi:hypothetical protein
MTKYKKRKLFTASIDTSGRQKYKFAKSDLLYAPIVTQEGFNKLLDATKISRKNKNVLRDAFIRQNLIGYGDGSDGGGNKTKLKRSRPFREFLPTNTTTIKNITKSSPKEYNKMAITKIKIAKATPRVKGSKTAKRKKSSQPSASNVNAALGNKINTNSTSAEGIVHGLSSGTNPGASAIPVQYESSAKSAQVLVNRGDVGRVFKSVYETGFRPSKALLMLAKQQGVEVKTMFDTKIDWQTSLLRNALTHGAGFNTKEYHIPSARAQMSYNDVRRNVLGGSTTDIDNFISSDERTLASVLNLKQQFMFRNNSVGFPLEVKIHIVKQKASPFGQAAMARMFFDIVPSTVEFGNAAVIRGKVPRWYLTGGYIFENSALDTDINLNFNASNKMKDLGISSTFRQMFDVVETFQKTLDPNDYWNFSHIHNCGAGIDLNILNTFGGGGAVGSDAAGQDNSLSNHPYLFGIIIETKGKLCEAAIVNSAGTEFDSYIGTSPTWWSYECKTTINLVRDNVDPLRAHIRRSRLRPVTLSAAIGDNLSDPKEIRASKLLFQSVVPALLPANAGQYYIPYESPTISTSRGTGFSPEPG